MLVSNVQVSSHYTSILSAPTNTFTENGNAVSKQFYKYIMRFNARFLVTICSALEAELRESGSKGSDAASEDGHDRISNVTESLLPALRIYGMWLAASRQEIFSDDESAGPTVTAMTQTIGRVFTLLCVETYNRDNLVSCPYLLPEDLDILGFLPLSGTQVPEACRVFCLENGQTKPHLFSQEQRLPPANEAMARILDILRCAYFLAEDAETSLTCNVVENLLVFQHQSDVAQGKSRQIAAPQVPRQALAEDTRAVDRDRDQRPQPMPVKGAARGPVPRSQAPEAQRSTTEQANDVGDAENTVINMLAPFLKPPTPDLQNAKGDQESSYGMHTASANELLASCQTDPSPTRSISSGKFAPLPWDWFNTPKPARGDAAAPPNGAVPRSPEMSPNGAASNTGRFDDPFYSPNMQQPGQNGFQAGPRAVSASTAEGSHRAQLLQSFTGGAARTSPFSQWGEERGALPSNHRQQRSPPGLQLPADRGFPQSSSASGFSHPSSLYQGTPAANGAGMHYSLSADMAGGFSRRDGAGRGASKDGFRSPSNVQRAFQMENTTTSYDEAILRAAYQGKK